MHVVTIDDKKIAIFWTTKCGFRTMYKILMDNFPCNDGKLWRTHSEKLPPSLLGYTFILLYRDPLDRLVSSYLMPQVPNHYTFKQFVNNYHHFPDHHQAPQASGPGLRLYNKFKGPNGFDYKINTKESEKLPIILSSLTKMEIAFDDIIEHVVIKDTQIDNNVEYYNLKKSDLRITYKEKDKVIIRNNGTYNVPPYSYFYTDEIRSIAKQKLKVDYDFFKSIGITFD